MNWLWNVFFLLLGLLAGWTFAIVRLNRKWESNNKPQTAKKVMEMSSKTTGLLKEDIYKPYETRSEHKHIR